MIISQEEVQEFMEEYARGHPNDVLYEGNVEIALEAAYRVRKERKRAKREKAIGILLPMDGQYTLVGPTGNLEFKGKLEGLKKVLSEAINPEQVDQPTPKPLTFEVGKSYRTRDGRKATVDKVSQIAIMGSVGGLYYTHWWSSGRHASQSIEHELDLISEWQD